MSPSSSEQTPLLASSQDSPAVDVVSVLQPTDTPGSLAPVSDDPAKTNGIYGSASHDRDVAEDNPELERQASIDEARQRQFEGNQEVRARLKYILPAVGVGIWMSAADSTLIVSTYAAIGSDLKELNKTSWIGSAYFLTLTSFQPLYGKLSDIFGRKTMLLIAYTIFGLGCLWCGLASDMNSLIIARAFTGVGGGGMATVVSILMSDIVPLQERGLWQGIINLIWAAGAGMGAPLGGLLADTIGWRLSFIGQAPLCLVAIIGVSFALKLPPPKNDINAVDDDGRSKLVRKLRRVDFLGAFTLVSSVTLLLVGLDRGSNVAWSNRVTIGTLAACVPCVAAFVYVESRVSAEPFAPGRVIFGRRMIGAFLCNFFSFGGWYGTLFYIPLYFQAAERISATRAGVLLIPGVIVGVMGSLGSGIVMRRTGRYFTLTVAAYAILFVGAAAMSFFAGPPAQSTGGVVASLAVGGFGNGIGVTTSLIALISNADPADQAIATACSYLFRSLGCVLGLAVISTMLQQQLRIKLNERLSADTGDVEQIVTRIRESLDYVDTLPPRMAAVVRQTYGESLRISFVVLTGITFLAFISAFFIREKRLSK